MINKNIFRTYDIRGKYPEELNSEVVFNIAFSYAKLFKDLKKIVVQSDIVPHNLELKKSFISGLARGGKEVADIGRGPVSLMYFSVCHFNYDGGVSLTASHLPPPWSGLKMQTKNAYPVITEELDKIREIAERDFQKLNENETVPKKISFLNPEKDYINYAVEKIKIKRPLKIIIDSGNGSCGFLPEKIFKKLGCEAITIFGDYDFNFPNHMPDPYEEKNLKFLQNAVIREKADLGVAFDNDGDRVGIVDNAGEIVRGDEYLLMFALDALAREKGPVVTEVRTSMAFIEKMRELGAKHYFSVSHHKAVLDKIKEVHAVFGGETTGHIYFPLQYYLFDDGIFSALKMAEIASNIPNLHLYKKSLPHYEASPEIFIPTPDEIKFDIIKQLQNYLRENNYDFIDIDGARINFENGWALARAANTSPYIKMRFEGRTAGDLAEIKEKTKEIFRKSKININFDI